MEKRVNLFGGELWSGRPTLAATLGEGNGLQKGEFWLVGRVGVSECN